MALESTEPLEKISQGYLTRDFFALAADMEELSKELCELETSLSGIVGRFKVLQSSVPEQV